MSILPAYFISHGSPDLLIREAPASDFLKKLTLPIENAKAILVVSAHWETDIVSITGSKHPKTIHDFFGFPKPLYDIHYHVNGNPDLAKDICTLLETHHIHAQIDHDRGLDHGAWMPLYLALPHCTIPVLQLSIQQNQSSHHHYRVGQALKALRHDGVIMIGSGNITHNLRAALHKAQNNDGIQYAKAFDDWMHHALMQRNDSDILMWHQHAPHAAWNHPSDDHLLPLFTVLGATENEVTTRIHHSFDFDVLSMASYKFG